MVDKVIPSTETKAAKVIIKKVMVVDDDMFCSQLVKMMLESIGQQVDIACNGKESVGLF